MNKKRIVVFSGSNAGTGEYVKMAKELGEKLAENNFTIVNGGGPGLMEIVAKAAYEKGGEVVGVHFEHEGRIPSKYNSETISYKDLYPRQQKIISMADAFVILPGGLGTTFEFIEVLAKKYLQEIDENIPIILVSGKFWKSALQMMQMQVDKGFMKKDILDNLIIVDSSEEVIFEFKKVFREINYKIYENASKQTTARAATEMEFSRR